MSGDGQVEALTLKLLDGELNDEEAEELERLVEHDPLAARIHVELVRQEAALRGWRTDLDLVAATMERLRAEQATRIEATVMERIRQLPTRSRPAEAHARRRASTRPFGRLAPAAAASLVLALGKLSLAALVSLAVTWGVIHLVQREAAPEPAADSSAAVAERDASQNGLAFRPTRLLTEVGLERAAGEPKESAVGPSRPHPTPVPGRTAGSTAGVARVVPTDSLAAPGSRDAEALRLEWGPSAVDVEPTRIQIAPVTPADAGPPVDAPLVQRRPRYPRPALNKGVEGRVLVAFTIDESGTVLAPRVVSAEPAGVFERAVLEAIRHWRYPPQTLDGRPVKVEDVRLEFRFVLAGK